MSMAVGRLIFTTVFITVLFVGGGVHLSPLIRLENNDHDLEEIASDFKCGVINFEQSAPRGPLRISGEVSGISEGKHGLTIHEYGDISKGWISAGNHFNPFKTNHGGPLDKIRHLGDLGNIEVDNDGLGKIDITDKNLSISGKNSILGRSLVIHELADDLGKGADRTKSKKTGNSGSGLAMGVIGIQKL